jgi:hypothetical protein
MDVAAGRRWGPSGRLRSADAYRRPTKQKIDYQRDGHAPSRPRAHLGPQCANPIPPRSNSRSRARAVFVHGRNDSSPLSRSGLAACGRDARPWRLTGSGRSAVTTSVMVTSSDEATTRAHPPPGVGRAPSAFQDRCARDAEQPKYRSPMDESTSWRTSVRRGKYIVDFLRATRNA